MDEIYVIKKNLESINIKSDKVAKYLFNEYHDDIKLLKKYNYIQIGGKIIDLIYEKNKYKFYLVKNEYGTKLSLIDNDNDASNCIIIQINNDSEKDIATLIGLEYNDYCVSDKIKSRSGSLLLKIALEFLKTYKKDLGIKRITLKDNSRKGCDGGKSIKLSEMYVLLYGDTWYGRYGFRPYNKKSNSLNESLNKLYEHNKKIMSKITLGYMTEKGMNMYKIIEFFQKQMKTKDVNLKSLSDYINKNQNQKLSDFLKIFLGSYENTCRIFAEFCPYLFTILKLYNFYGELFYLDI